MLASELDELEHSGAVPQVTPVAAVDLWKTPHPWVDASGVPEADAITGAHRDLYDPLNVTAGQRIGDDVILTNVIGFDVKVWDPGAPLLSYSGVVLAPGDPGYAIAAASGAGITKYGAYVDLGYAPAYVPSGNAPRPLFNGLGSPLLPRIYDTWSVHYEHDGINQDGDTDASGAPLIDEGTNGFDDDGNGIVDDVAEMEAGPPYWDPLRGVQVKIRTFEPDSRQVREVTVVVDFLPK